MPRADIHIRTSDPTLGQRLRDGASVRGWTLAQYLDKLLLLHSALRYNADHEAYPAMLLLATDMLTVQKEG